MFPCIEKEIEFLGDCKLCEVDTQLPLVFEHPLLGMKHFLSLKKTFFEHRFFNCRFNFTYHMVTSPLYSVSNLI